MRITEKALAAVYARFLRNIGGVDGEGPGQYSLEYVSCYGGYKVTLGGGQEPFGSSRHKKTEMYYMLSFANAVLEHQESKRRYLGA